MTDWSDVAKIRAFSKACDYFGFEIEQYSQGDGKLIALKATDKLPAFWKEMPISSGTIDELYAFLHGWEQAYNYLHAIGAVDSKRIKTKQKQYMEKIRQARKALEYAAADWEAQDRALGEKG